MNSQNHMFYHDNGVGIHVLTAIVEPSRPTLLYLPGMSGEAQEGFKTLSPGLDRGFNAASMSFRGRVLSTTPKIGYTVGDHAKDIALVLENIRAKLAILVANCVSTLYTAKYILDFGVTGIAGLVLVDHPWRAEKLEKSWADRFSQLQINGVGTTVSMPPHFLTRKTVNSTIDLP